MFDGSDVVTRDAAATDWAATPLGPSPAWPPELRAVVRVVLTSRFPMWMAWGPELTMLYNDAYRRETLLEKHPWALGRPSDEVWAEVWDDVTPQVRAVLDEGRSTWDEDLLLHLRRRGWPEETYHTFSYSPLTDGEGTVRGLLCVVAETTGRVLGQRRMALLHDLTSATAGTRSAPAVLRAARSVLAAAPRDLPVGLLYLIEDGAPDRAQLLTAVGTRIGGPAAPRTIDLGSAADDAVWPLARAARGTQELVPPPEVAAALPPDCDRVALVALIAPSTDDGGLLGVLVLGLSRHLAFDRRYRAFVELVGGHVTSAVVEARAARAHSHLRTEERTAAERLALVQRTTAALSAAATPVGVARVVVGQVAELLGSSAQCAVFELDAPTATLRVLQRRPAVPDERSHGDVVGLDVDTLITRAVRSERPIWVHEPEPGEPGESAAQDSSLVALMRARGLRNVVVIPLIAAGRVVGAVAVSSERRGALDAGERTTLLALAEPCGVALDRARLYRAEHEIAETLQRSLLPQGLPDIARLPIAVRYVPGASGTSAGGDWYDVVEIDDRRVAVVVGDVVGQGTGAAAVMGQLRTALSGYLLAGHGPAAALDLLDGLVARVPGARASTAICLVVDVACGEVRWSRAGHLPALVHDGTPHLLTDPAGHGALLGLGALHRRARTEGVVTIAPGTSVVLYTDGLVERRGESLDEGLDRLLDVAAGRADGRPEPLATHLVDRLAPTVPVDDVAVVVVRLAPAPLETRLPAEPSRLAVLRRRVRDWSAGVGLPDAVVEDLQLALGEAVTNAVEHAYGPRPPVGAGVSVRVAPGRTGGVAVEVRDEGAWREAPRDAGYRGRGLTLIRALADDVTVHGGPEGTRVRFTVPAPTPS